MNIEIQLSEQTFQNRQAIIKNNVLAYIDIKQKSQFIVICLHEHYGLHNYLRLMVQYITDNQYSIVIPSLFNDSENNSQQNDDAAFLAGLDHSKIAEIVYSVVDYAAKSGKAIILMGFSIGAAIGLKMLQYITSIDMAFLFYGLPPLDGINPELIQTQTKIFLASNDSIKYLSDRTLTKKAKRLYSSNQKIEVIEVEGAQHGFMNPASPSYSQKDFEYFSSMVQENIQKFSKKKNNLMGGEEKRPENILSNPSQQQESVESPKKESQQSKKQVDQQKKQAKQEKKQQSKQDSCALI